MRAGLDIPAEAVDVLKEKYHGFDKPLWSRCRYPEKYGVRLTADAEKLLTEKGVKIPRKSRDKRSKVRSNKITFRTSEEIFSALQLTLDKEKNETMQDALGKAVRAYLDEQTLWNKDDGREEK